MDRLLLIAQNNPNTHPHMNGWRKSRQWNSVHPKNGNKVMIHALGDGGSHSEMLCLVKEAGKKRLHVI